MPTGQGVPPIFPDLGNMESDPNGGIDVDALVKRIDEKIAQLEEEERLEKEKQSKENAEASTPTTINESQKDNKTEEITDDEFFDDFFLDD